VKLKRTIIIGDVHGMLLLALFKLADIDGHVNVEDVCWFSEQTNSNYPNQKGKWIPVPTPKDVKRLKEQGRLAIGHRPSLKFK